MSCSTAAARSRFDDLRDDLEAEFDMKPPQSSMGMNGDFAFAIEEGVAAQHRNYPNGTQHCSFFRSNPVRKRAAWSRLTA